MQILKKRDRLRCRKDTNLVIRLISNEAGGRMWLGILFNEVGTKLHRVRMETIELEANYERI